ncbi:putative DCC family thiol-disulfide oxidoreductase YuxK [Marinoscillum furvescens DSM 4134]|uniref:Putative DCC family thiol-disulfide oxidoreductase YuxK n=2 Tax=Marinoscillum furvescens TaxID=1026 RepID=A0A3D9KZD1_MARFU|nr:putative DCC family thiol-disulfide oxidoreductase YuxK [Marinoscillum furvescens DSM 4134]
MDTERMGENPQMSAVILFDGVCNLCNSSVDFVIRRDKQKRFQFASLQSPEAEQLLKEAGSPQPTELESVVLVKEDRVYNRSDAALEIARNLSGLWPLLYVFKLIPRALRDAVYRYIAKKRYRWFGKRDTCRLPDESEKERFLDSP